MPIITAHGTVIVVDAEDGRLRHIPVPTAARHSLAELPHIQSAGYAVEHTATPDTFHLKRASLYLSADQRSDALHCDRTAADGWETFSLVAEEALFADNGDSLATGFLRDYQLGNLKQAIAGLAQVVAHYPRNHTARLHLGLARALLDPSPSEPPQIILQCNLQDLWEGDWLNSLLGDRLDSAVRDGSHQIFASQMIVVDHALTSEKARYYQEAFSRGNRVCLIHLGDESFVEDLSAYLWCHTVWRNYWSPILARQPNLRFFPLGYKSGFATGAPPPSAAERRHVWAFAGDAKKSSRQRMLQALQQVPGGQTHLTSHFASTDALPTSLYRQLLEDAVFVPCPAGLANVETFRIYEALEAGAIPILEVRPGFDYFGHLFGDHPMPCLTDWNDAPALIASVKPPATADRLQKSCAAWWRVFKRALRNDFASSFDGLATPRY